MKPPLIRFVALLKTHNNLNDIRTYIQASVESSSDFSGCFPFIDADDNASMFEVNRSNWVLEYDSIDPNREAQGLLGFVVRANEFHQRTNGTDDIDILGRYQSGTYNVSGLVSIDQVKWNFGDDTTSTEISPSHTYAEAGTYLVSSTVMDDDSVSLTSWMYLDVAPVCPHPVGHADFIIDSGGLGLDEFAINFGKINCPYF